MCTQEQASFFQFLFHHGLRPLGQDELTFRADLPCLVYGCTCQSFLKTPSQMYPDKYLCQFSRDLLMKSSWQPKLTFTIVYNKTYAYILWNSTLIEIIYFCFINEEILQSCVTLSLCTVLLYSLLQSCLFLELS